MGRVTTPRVISPEIHELCKSISEYEPVFIPVIADPRSLINECFFNVDEYIAEHGGQRILGRSIWQRANVLIEAEAHAVWESPTGEIIDVTPHTNGVSVVLFQADPKMTHEGNCIPNIRKALTTSTLVAEFIGLYDERDRIASETPGSAYSLSTAMLRRMYEIEQLLNQQAGRNDPCPCQSGIKYKKCCGQYDT